MKHDPQDVYGDGIVAVEAESSVADPVPAPPEVPLDSGRRHARKGAGRAGGTRTVVATVVTWAAGATAFFWAQVSTSFDSMMGNRGDARLIVYLNEHWYQVLHGSVAWRDPAIFYPTRDVLGYTDTFFLWQPVYAVLRLMGADLFLAFQLTIVALSFLGFTTFVALSRTAFGASRFVALVGALVFTFAPNLETHAGSPQLFGIYFVPGIALLVVGAWRRRERGMARSVALAAVAGVLAGLLLFSTYYVAWFSLVTMAIVALLAALWNPRAALASCRSAASSGWRTMLAAGGGLAVGLVPFVTTYLPVVHTLGVRHYGDAMHFAPALQDLVNVTKDNRIWGRLLAPAWNVPAQASYEVSYALTPLLLGTVLGGGILVAASALSGRARLDGRRRLTLALCATPLVLALLPVRTSAGSAWVLIWHLPGATAIRAIDRIQIASDLVAALALVALASDPWLRSALDRRRPWLRAAASVLLVAVVAEQVSQPTSSQLHRTTELAALGAVQPAPAGCTTFYVIDRPGRVPFYADLTEAMLVSQRLRLPTLDGYSGDTPPGWGLLFPARPGADSFAHAWALGHGITTGVCRLDLATDTWQGPYPTGW